MSSARYQLTELGRNTSMETAFVIFTPVGARRQVMPVPLSGALRSRQTLLQATVGQRHRCAVWMSEQKEEILSPAEQTRRALSEKESIVKFSRKLEIADNEKEFRYTSGTTEGGLDIWLITAILTLVVPAVGFAIGVATGNIDINPR